MAAAALPARIEALIAPSLEAMGYEIVRVHLSGKHNPTLQIMTERSDRRGMTVDDCAEVSRTVSALLDVEDPIAGTYQLEVSSPGIDRPLVRPTDFERFAGFEARVEMREAVDGRKRFRGRLLGLNDGRVRLRVDEGEVVLPVEAIAKAKLILTDELVAASLAHERRKDS